MPFLNRILFFIAFKYAHDHNNELLKNHAFDIIHQKYEELKGTKAFDNYIKTNESVDKTLECMRSVVASHSKIDLPRAAVVVKPMHH